MNGHICLEKLHTDEIFVKHIEISSFDRTIVLLLDFFYVMLLISKIKHAAKTEFNKT